MAATWGLRAWSNCGLWTSAWGESGWAHLFFRSPVLPVHVWGKLKFPAAAPSHDAEASPSPTPGGGSRCVRKSILKAPKASELSPQVAARASLQERTPREAVIQVQIRKYTDDASACVHTLPTQPFVAGAVGPRGCAIGHL